MRSICTTDLKTYTLGTVTTESTGNSIVLNFLLPLDILSAYIEITAIDGTITNTTTLTPTNSMITYVLPSGFYMTAGTVKMRAISVSGYSSDQVDFVVNETFKSTDKIFVEVNGDAYVIKKSISAGGGGGTGGTTDYNELENKPKLNTTNTSSLETSSSETINSTVQLHKISKTGSYNDLNNKPSYATVATTGSYNDLIDQPEIPDISGKEDIANRVPTIDENSDNQHYPTAEAVYLAIQSLGTMIANEHTGSYVFNDLLIQWGRLVTTTVAGQPTPTKVYYESAYANAPLVLQNPYIKTADVERINIDDITTTSFNVYVTRINSIPTHIGWLSIGKVTTI